MLHSESTLAGFSKKVKQNPPCYNEFMTQEVKNVFEILNHLAELSLYRDNEVVFIGETKHPRLGKCVVYSLYHNGHCLCSEVPFPEEIDKWKLQHIAVVIQTANSFVRNRKHEYTSSFGCIPEIYNNTLADLMKTLAAADLPQHFMTLSQYPYTGGVLNLLNVERDVSTDYEDFREYNRENLLIINPSDEDLKNPDRAVGGESVLKERNYEQDALTAGEF